MALSFGALSELAVSELDVPASSDITLGLTGNAITSAPGSIAPFRTVAVTGNSITSACGTLLPSLTFGLSGNQIASATGFITVPGDKTFALTGNAVTSAIGTLSPGLSKALSGNSVTSAVGTLGRTSLVTLGLTGNVIASTVGSVALGGDKTIALTGCSAVFTAGNISVASGQIWTPVTITPASWTAQSGGTDPWSPVVPPTNIWTPQ